MLDSMRKSIQNEFKDQNEKVLYTVHVTRSGRRKKHSILCIIINEKNELLLYQMKKNETNDSFRKSCFWSFNNLKKIDCHCNLESLVIDLYLDKAYTWEMDSYSDKEAFIQILYRLCNQYLSPDYIPLFANLPSSFQIENEVLYPDHGKDNISPLSDKAGIESSSSHYQLISKKEEKDLENIMHEYVTNSANRADNSASEFTAKDGGESFEIAMLDNIESMSDKLTKELNLLDGSNIHTLMGSESDLASLLGLLDQAICDISLLEGRLQTWDTNCLNHVRGHMEAMDEKDISLRIVQANRTGLKRELEGLLDNLEYPSHYKRILMESELSDLGKIKELNRAVSDLHKSIQYAQNHNALKKMKAVQEKLSEYETLRNQFSLKLSLYLSSLFNKINVKLIDTYDLNSLPNIPISPTSNTLSKLDQINHPSLMANHKNKLLREYINPYKDLIKWLKESVPDKYMDILKNYLTLFGSTYEKECKYFFTNCRSVIEAFYTSVYNTITIAASSDGRKNIGMSNNPQYTAIIQNTKNLSSNLNIDSMNPENSQRTQRSERKRDNWIKEMGISGIRDEKNTDESPYQNLTFAKIFEQIIIQILALISEEEESCISIMGLDRAEIPTIGDEIPQHHISLHSYLLQSPNKKNITKMEPKYSEPELVIKEKNERKLSAAFTKMIPGKLGKHGAGIHDTSTNEGDELSKDPIEISHNNRSPTKKTDKLELWKNITDKEFLANLFLNITHEFDGLLTHIDKVDKLLSVAMFLHLLDCLNHSASKKSHTHQNRVDSSYASIFLINATVYVRKYCEKYISTLIKNMESSKHIKRINKSEMDNGIIDFVPEFQDVVERLEMVYRQNSQTIISQSLAPTHPNNKTSNNYMTNTNESVDMMKRRELEKWYTLLIRATFNNINRIAFEQTKLPGDLVMFENYHLMITILSTLKLPIFEMEKREAKQKYKAYLQTYVESMLGKPLEKLNIYFENVEMKVSQGIKEHEIGFQVAFSKSELRKIIAEYPGKEVKRRLESLYKTVDRHMGPNNNLLQVVWRLVQEEFIKQYKNFEQLIMRCYPDSHITMEFTLDELLNYFSDIALQH